MITDSFFVQGSTHEVCEDYAVHGENYAIISDGCSNGGGPRIHTDFGSRILAKAAEEHIDCFSSPNNLFQAICATARTQQRTFPNLPEACLTATLMMLKEVGNSYQALTVGDGVVGGKKKDGTWTIHVIQYPEGGPFYLKYQMFGEVDLWLKQFGGNYKIQTYTGNILNPDMPIELTEKEYEFDGAIVPHNMFSFSKEEFEFAFIASDGLESFYTPVKTQNQKYNHKIPILDVMRVAMNFVSIRPGFARLQANWAFRQDKAGTFKRLNWLNGDDVSVGIIHESSRSNK